MADPRDAVQCEQCRAHLGYCDGPVMGTLLCLVCFGKCEGCGRQMEPWRFARYCQACIWDGVPEKSALSATAEPLLAKPNKGQEKEKDAS